MGFMEKRENVLIYVNLYFQTQLSALCFVQFFPLFCYDNKIKVLIPMFRFRWINGVVESRINYVLALNLKLICDEHKTERLI